MSSGEPLPLPGDTAGSSADYVDSKDVLCVLEEDDVQCGHIYFNDATRVLKFFCIFCKETYENINYYCEHLSTHINDNDTNEGDAHPPNHDNKTEISSEGYYSPPLSTMCAAGEDNEGDASMHYGNGTPNAAVQHDDDDDVKSESNSCSADFLGYDEQEDNIIVDETEQMVKDEEEEASVEMERSYEEFTALDKAQSVSAEDDDDDDDDAAMDFENMIDATNIRSTVGLDSAPPEQKKRRGKKVTTVKVIAVKNRIAELYERIKSEEEKRSQMRAFDVVQSDGTMATTGDCMDESLDTTNESETGGGGAEPVQMQRQVIGETVITLLPDNGGKKRLSASADLAAESAASQALAASDLSAATKAKEKVCPACGMQFRSSFSLTIHKRIHYLESNSEVKLAHKCSDCDRLFNKISEMKVHLERVHYPDGFICKICQKKLTSLTLLEKHMRLVHLNKPFSCQICQKSYETRSLYESHVDTHIEGRNFKCPVCGRKYGSEQSMRYHMRRHKEQVPQCCVVCGKMTLRITQHMKIHTPRPKRVLTCKACGKLFNFSSGLSHHFKIMHKQPRPPPKPKKDTPTCSSNSARRKRKPRAASSAKGSVDDDDDDDQQALHLLRRPDNDDEENEEEEHHRLRQRQHQPEQQAGGEQQQQPPLAEGSHDSGTLMALPPQHYQQQQLQQLQLQQQQQEVNEKEEEAKRVIVELIQNATYPSFLPDHHMNDFEVGPPIAREETISAVNSIANDC